MHFKKDFSIYHHLSSTIIGARPEIANVNALGTDAEEALVNAFLVQMWDGLIHLRCTRHLEGNFREFFKSHRYPANLEAEEFDFIFGDGGLIDSEDVEDFNFNVGLFKDSTVKLHESFDVCPDAFLGYFDKNKEDIFRNNMIRSVRIAAGLGNSQARYYTSNNEPLNNRLKIEQNHKKL